MPHKNKSTGIKTKAPPAIQEPSNTEKSLLKTVKTTPMKPSANKWNGKVKEFEDALEKTIKQKNERIDFLNFKDMKIEIEETKKLILTRKVNEFPSDKLSVLAKLTEDSEKTLTMLTEFVHSLFFPERNKNKDSITIHLTETSKEYPISLLTIRESVLKVAKRKLFGFKISFSKNKNDEIENDCEFLWKMNIEYMQKLPSEFYCKVREIRTKQNNRKFMLRSLNSAIIEMSSNVPNVEKILIAIDKVQKTSKKIEMIEENKKIKLKEKIEKANQKTLIKKALIKKTLIKKTKLQLISSKTKPKIKKIKPKNIIFDYFSTVKSKNQEKDPIKEVWYRPWQTSEHTKLPAIKKPLESLKLHPNPNFKTTLPIFKERTLINSSSINDINNNEKKKPQKIKFRFFYEDYRPAFLGTFHKKAFSLNGRRVFSKDRSLFNYSVDSEDEWGDEPEDADEIGSEDEICNLEEEDLKGQGKLRRDGLIQDDDFLEPENDSELNQNENPNQLKELVPEHYYVPDYNKVLNPQTEEEHKAARVLRRFTVEKFDVEPLEENKYISSNLMDPDLCGIKEGTRLYQVIKHNFEKRKKALEESKKAKEPPLRIEDLSWKVEALKRKIGSASGSFKGENNRSIECTKKENLRNI